jgi:hypothetical protein
VPLAVAGHLQRVDRPHLVAGRQQRPHPRAPVGLDADYDLLRLGVLVLVLGEQLVQPGDPGDPLLKLGLGQPSSRLVLDLHVVVVLGPVVPDEQHPVLPFFLNSDP